MLHLLFARPQAAAPRRPPICQTRNSTSLPTASNGQGRSALRPSEAELQWLGSASTAGARSRPPPWHSATFGCARHLQHESVCVELGRGPPSFAAGQQARWQWPRPLPRRPPSDRTPIRPRLSAPSRKTTASRLPWRGATPSCSSMWPSRKRQLAESPSSCSTQWRLVPRRTSASCAQEKPAGPASPSGTRARRSTA